MKRKIVPFRAEIPPSSTRVFYHRIAKAGSVEGVNTRIYSGPQGSLRIVPELVNYNDSAQPLLLRADAGDKQSDNDLLNLYISGDDDVFEHPTYVPTDVDDYIKLTVTNTDATYTYSLVCDVVLTEV
jgi:hypothetical protein